MSGTRILMSIKPETGSKDHLLPNLLSLSLSLSLSLCLSVNDSALTNRACLDAIMAIKINPMINPPHTNRSLVRGGGEAEMQLLQ